MFTTCVPGPQRGQMKVLDLLELGLQEVMSHYMGDGKQTHVHSKFTKYSGDIPPILQSMFL